MLLREEKFCYMSVQPGDANYGRFHRRPLPASCLDMSGAPAQALFAAAFSAGFAKAFFPLISQFRTQDEPSYCGISTLVMCLNALAVDPGQVRCRQHLFFFRSRSLLPPRRSAAAAHTRTQRKLTPYFNIARYSTSNPRRRCALTRTPIFCLGTGLPSRRRLGTPGSFAWSTTWTGGRA